MKTCMLKVQYILFALLMFTLAACSGNSSSTTSSAPGAVAAKLVFNDGKTAGKTLAALPAVTSVRLMVTGATIPTAKQDFPGITGGTLPVYPGSDLIVTAFALDSTGAVVFEGYKTGIAVASGATTDVGQITMNQPVVKAENSACLNCHETVKDITGQNLIANYKQSGHYTNTSWLANAKNGSTLPGCAGCHGTQHQDITPSESGRCFECHGTNLSLRHTKAGVPLTNARYLSIGNNNCSACHEPHNPINGVGKQERKDWAESGHGNVNALAWMDYDFTTRATCNACHTPTGFVQAIGSTWSNTAVIPGTAMQPLTCDGCHSSNDFANSVRTVAGPYSAGMGGYGTAKKASIIFEDVKGSNLCIPCHASRENSASMTAAVADFTNNSFVNPHYLGEAAVFYGKGGFQFYTSNARYNRYAAERVGAAAGWSHGRLGIDNYATSTNPNAEKVAANVVASGSNGQCISCHMGAGPISPNHHFNAYEVAKATWTATQKGCYGCHGTEDMEEVGIGEKALFDRGMAFFKWQLAQTGAVYSDAYPYFYKADGVTQLKNWLAADTTAGMFVSGGNGPANMGSAMNYKLLSAAKGSYVHNRAFARALMADSITYLQKGDVGNRSVASTDPNTILNFTNYSTALAASPDTIKNPANATATATLVPGAVVSISQLKGWILRKSGSNYTRR